ncbi:MAG: FG-GAP repeat domain-containing protein, partial [Aeoliella sp.]
EQSRGVDGQIDWKKHEILPAEPDLESGKLRFSQPHALKLVDMNGDGLLDFVTGKRFWAHGPDGDKEPNAPAVVYWFELQRITDGTAQFIPHQIDNNSGVGTQVTATDLNGDGAPDVITSNKKGTFLFFSRSVD